MLHKNQDRHVLQKYFETCYVPTSRKNAMATKRKVSVHLIQFYNFISLIAMETIKDR